jgi:hypothetical protein
MDAVDVSTTNVARKDTVAVLDGVAVVAPEMRTIRESGAVNVLGIPKPANAPTAAAGAAGNPDGAYIYKVTFKDSTKGYFGEGSDTFSITVASQKVVIDLTPITNEADHSEVDILQIWRSLAGGTILFLVDEIAIPLAASYTDDASDASISVNDTLPVAEQAYKFLSADTFGWVVRTKDRLMFGGSRNYYENHTTRNQCAWTPVEPNSGIPFVEAVPDENYGTFENGGKHLRGGTMLGDVFVVFEDDEIWNWVWIDNPDTQVGNGSLAPMGIGRGTVAFKTIVNADGDVWSMDMQGFFNYRGGQSITDVTEPIVEEFKRINWNERAQFHGAYDDKRIYFFVALDADTECKHVFVLDRKSVQASKGIRWWLYKLPQGVRDSCVDTLGDSNENEDFNLSGRKVVRIITPAGYEGMILEGVYTDMVHPEITKEGDIDSASAQVMTMAAGTFKVDNATLAGVFVEFDHPSTPEPLEIASSTATTFTLKTALSAALPAGTTFKLGLIKGHWTSGQLDAGGPEAMKHYTGVGVVVNPLPEEGEIRVVTRNGRLGEFVSGVDETNRTGYELEQYKPGTVLKTGGRSRGTGNRDGYKEVPVHGRDGRYIEVEIQDESYLPWELVGYYVKSTAYPKD